MRTGVRKYGRCPECRNGERQRLQYLVMLQIPDRDRLDRMRVLHFSPEPIIAEFLSARAAQYETADLCSEQVDHEVDMQDLPFPAESYDLVYASHVLEHIPDDTLAIREVRRILRPRGLAILPVPIITEHTVEYGRPNPDESEHVRAPGLDYFDRYRSVFSKVECFSSESFPDEHQLFAYEDRTGPFGGLSALRQPMQGEKHLDFVPVCYV